MLRIYMIFVPEDRIRPVTAAFLELVNGHSRSACSLAYSRSQPKPCHEVQARHGMRMQLALGRLGLRAVHPTPVGIHCKDASTVLGRIAARIRVTNYFLCLRQSMLAIDIVSLLQTNSLQ